MATATAPMAATTEKAGWWTRFLAILIDFIGLGIIGGIVSGLVSGGDPTNGTAQGLVLLLQAVYFTYFWSAAGKGQTLGMRALNIKVVKTDGSQLDYVGGFLRYIGLVISIWVFLIGVIWAAFDAQKQGWHDKIAGTYVVKA